MRRPLLCSLIALVCACASSYGQGADVAEDWCGTEAPADYLAPHEADPEAFAAFREGLAAEKHSGRAGSCVTSYPLNIYVIRYGDGSGGLTEGQIEGALQTVNARFAEACLGFYSCGYTFVDDDDLAVYSNSDADADLQRVRGEYFDPEALNLYFAPTVRSADGGGLCGFAYYPNQGQNIVFMANSCSLNGSTLSHELGHAFGLPHTHGRRNGTLTDELVDGSNCATAGDGFCDTPADPQLSFSTVDRSCVYTGATVDGNGGRFAPDPRLLMSYSRKECRDVFSAEQSAAMRFNARNAYDRTEVTCAALTPRFALESGPAGCDLGEAFTFAAELGGADAYAWDLDNDGSVEGTGRTFSYTPATAGARALALSVTAAGRTVRAVAEEAVRAGGAEFPYVQGFEPDSPPVDGYEVLPGANGLRWGIGSGRTSSGDTGPEGGFDASRTYSGSYIHVEASGSYASRETTTLVTPCLQVPPARFPEEAELVFRYHMYGADIGELHVDLETSGGLVADVTAPLIGQQNASEVDAWRERRVSLVAYAEQSVRVRFRAVYGGGFRGDIALDDIEIAGQAALPVELVAFGAEGRGGSVAVTWRTGAEVDASHFVVERAGAEASGANAFAPVGTVPAANAALGEAYAFTDATAAAGLHYYRLRAVDLDGAEELSEVRSVLLGDVAAGGAVSAYPNPVSHALTIVGGAEGDAFAVVDQLGRTLAAPGLPGGRIDVSALPVGVYQLVVTQASGRRTLRFVVER